jgi:hypothetical protein
VEAYAVVVEPRLQGQEAALEADLYDLAAGVAVGLLGLGAWDGCYNVWNLRPVYLLKVTCWVK